METLYHYSLCPFSRKIRLLCAEKKLTIELEIEPFWEKRKEFLALNPFGKVPVFVDKNGYIVSESNAICEYIEEIYPQSNFIGDTPKKKAEIRRMVQWLDDGLAHQVTLPLLREKNLYRIDRTHTRGPDSSAIRLAKNFIHDYLKFIEFITEQNHCLVGDQLTLADFCASAHLSVIDYMGDVPWEHYPNTKNWYAKLKSRPSFRGLLGDRAQGLLPSEHYTNLDF